MGHLQCWVFGLFVSPLATQWIGHPTAGVGRTPDGKNDLAAVPPHTADGGPDLPGWWVTGRPGTRRRIFRACELSTAKFANLAWTPQGRLRGDLCLDGAGNPTTDATKTTERFRRVTFGPLETG